jgi:hypothetical protein
MPDVDEIADGIHRIATFLPEEGLTFNQFLLASDEPLLFHTGPRALFGETLAGIARILDPTRLRWVSWSHFEADECGALNDFLELAPAAEPLHSELGAGLNGSDFAIRPVRARSPTARCSTWAGTGCRSSSHRTCRTGGMRSPPTRRLPERCSSAMCSPTAARALPRPIGTWWGPRSTSCARTRR